MKIRVIKPRELDKEHIKIWKNIQKSRELYNNPYFSVEFIQSVDSVREDVYLAILMQEGEVSGYFPFQQKKGIGRPVGLGLSDYHGVIAYPHFIWTSEELLDGCGLIRWEFDHLPSFQNQFLNSEVKEFKSPILRIDNGFDDYFKSLKGSGRNQIKEIQRKERKIVAEGKAVEFTQHTDEIEILETLMQWKSLQCKRTGTVDYFEFDWCRQLISQIHKIQSNLFKGMLSCLYIDNQLAALHFGMSTDSILHSWFPAYDHQFESYSPGSILLLKIIESAAESGLKLIDLGKGLSVYKRKLMNDSFTISEGFFGSSNFRNSTYSIMQRLNGKELNHFEKAIFYIPRKIVYKNNRERRYN